MLIDAHCHLDHLGFASACSFLEHLGDKNLKTVIASGTKPADWLFYQKLVECHNNIKVCCGIHPLEISETWENDLVTLEKILPQCVAVGEIGLDFHGIFQSENIETMKLQMKVFEKQLLLAKKYNKPIVIHCREAFTILKEILLYAKFPLNKVLFHCFVEDIQAAQWIKDNDGYVSYSGVLTFKKPGHTQTTAAWMPLDHILIETDSPYLAPVPLRGKINSPEYVVYVAQKLAEIKNISFSECATQTTDNAHRFFGF